MACLSTLAAHLLQGDLDALLQYIDDNGDVNQRDRDNNTPLHWACQESHFDIVGVLMSRNSAVDPVNDLQSTPLHYACREVRRQYVVQERTSRWLV